MNDPADFLEIKTSIVEIKGEVRALAEAMRSGDRDSVSGVRLLAQTVENIGKMQEVQRADLKEAITEFRKAVETVRDLTSHQASVVRTSLEGQLREHADAEAPHDKTLGSRMDRVETRINWAIGASSALGLAGVANIATLIITHRG